MGGVRVERPCNKPGPSRFQLSLLTIPSLLLFVLTVSPAAAQPNAKNVLVLYSFLTGGEDGSLDLLESSVRASVRWPVNFYIEYLEVQRFDEKDENYLVEHLRNAYGGRKLDLVIVDGPSALDLAVRRRDELFAGAPIVFFDLEARRIAGQKMWPAVTGVTDTFDAGATIDLALRLHPNTDTIAVIGGKSEYERYWLAFLHADLVRRRDKVREIDLFGLPSSQLLEAVAGLPPHTVVLFELSPQTSINPAISNDDILAWVGHRLPTYCAWPPNCVDRGGIGGVALDGVERTSLAAHIAGRILSGERPEAIPVAHVATHHIWVDWRQLHRWHIPDSALPAGSVVDFKPPSPWQQYKWEIIVTLVVLVLLLALVVGLLTNLLRRRKAEASNKMLAGQLLHVQDEERRRMARDLHDGTSQDLVAISVCLREVLENPSPDPNETRQVLEEVHSLSVKAQREVRSVSYALHPPLLDGTGLVPALQWYLDGLRKRSGLRIVLEAPPGMEPMTEVDGTLFRIVQESMSNILRHSGADTAQVQLERDSKCVRMRIEDNGHGMGVTTVSGNGNGVPLGVGITGMRERVRQLGGTFEIRSESGRTTVLVSLPVTEKAYAANHASG